MSKQSRAKPKSDELPATSATIPPGREEVNATPTDSKRLALQAEVDRLQATIDDVPEVVGPGARAGFVARRREAEEKIAGLKKQIADLNRSRAAYVRVTGPLSAEAIESLETEGPTVVLDASQPYEDLAEAILPVLNKTLTFDIAQYQRLVEVLGGWGRERGVASMPRPHFSLRSCGDRFGLVAHIRRSMEHETAFLGEYAAMCLRPEIDQQVAVAKEFSDVVHVVVINDVSGLVTANLVASGGRGGKTLDTTDLKEADTIEAVFGALEAAGA